MFQQEKKYLSGGINADDAPFAVGETELINAVNHRFGSSEDGAIGYNESVPGNVLIPHNNFIFNSGVPIGYASDEVNNRLIIFYCGDIATTGIYCLFIETGTVLPVMFSNNVIGGLGLDPAFRINEAFVINGKVYWTDNNRQPSCINIEAGLKFENPDYVTSVTPYGTLDQNTIRLIKKTQNLPLLIRKVRSADVPAIASYTSNHIANESYQFFVRYIYRDYERSVIGPFSKLAEYNYKESPLNAVEVTFDPAEDIHEDVTIVQLGVRYNNIGAGFIIKQWDKSSPADAAAIAAHNASVPLRYYFTNTESGIAVDPVDLAKPFDSIPLKSKTAALARNRYFLGNNLFGYTAPPSTSLAISATVFPSIGGLMGTWYTYVVSYDLGPTRHVTMPAIFIDLGASAAKRYVFIQEVQLDYSIDITNDVGLVNSSFVYPVSVSNSKITLQTNSLAEIDALISKLRRALVGTTTNLVHSSPVNTGKSVLITNNLTSGGSRTFKSGSATKVGIVFLDEDRRKCGVVTNDSLKKTFPGRTFSQIAFSNVLTWTVSNTNALIQIPDWAHYYSIVRTKNLTTDFFFQGHAIDTSYVSKDADGNYLYTHMSVGPGGVDSDVVGVGLRIKDMFSYGIGYSFTEGDLVDLYFPARATVYGVPVIAQDADWIIIDRINIGALTAEVQVLFDLYTPHKESINEGFYEIGDIYEINSPGTSSRTFSKLTGTLTGDVYAISRTSTLFSYVAEAMSPNDHVWKSWTTDAGWINIIDSIGQQRRQNSIAWSNVLIPGTKSNGLGSFDALDVIDLPVEQGDLTKLILTNKVQDEGSVMLAICRRETSSIYLGETQVLGSDGSVSFIASSRGVIGTINLLKGSYGTSHAESVKEHRGYVQWFDVINGCLVQYSSNGLFPISNYKLTKYFKKYAKRYIATSSVYPIIGGIDPSSEEYIISMLAEEDSSYAGTLPTLSDQKDFEIYSGKSKSIVFKTGMQKFISTYPFYFQMILNTGTSMYSFMRGRLFKHSETLVPDSFFDEQQYTTKLMFLANSNPGKPKIFSNIAVQGNMAPVRAIFYCNDINEQITDLVAADFVNKEGVWYADLRRDRLSPNVTGTPDEKMYKGDKIRSQALKVQLEFDTSAKKLQLEFVNIGYHLSQGHTI